MILEYFLNRKWKINLPPDQKSRYTYDHFEGHISTYKTKTRHPVHSHPARAAVELNQNRNGFNLKITGSKERPRYQSSRKISATRSSCYFRRDHRHLLPLMHHQACYLIKIFDTISFRYGAPESTGYLVYFVFVFWVSPLYLIITYTYRLLFQNNKVIRSYSWDFSIFNSGPNVFGELGPKVDQSIWINLHCLKKEKALMIFESMQKKWIHHEKRILKYYFTPFYSVLIQDNCM